MSDVFNLKDLVVNILRKWRWMLGFAIVFGILLGGYKYMSGTQELGNAATAINSNKEFEEEKKQLEEEIQILKNSIKDWKEYYTNSEFVKTDAYNSEVYNISFLIITNDNVDNSGLLSNDIASAYVNMISSGSIYDGFDLEAMDIDLCSNLISAEAEGSLVSISAVLDSKGKTKAVAEEICNKIESNELSVNELKDSYSVQFISKNIAQLNDLESESLAAKQSNVVVWGDRYQTSLDTKKKQLETLKSENGYIEVTKRSVIVDTIKFTIVGILGGIVFGIILGLILDLMGNKLRNKKELDRDFSLSCIGNPYMIESNEKKNFVDRCIDRLDGNQTVICNFEEKMDYIVANINMLLSNHTEIKEIAIVGSISNAKIQQLTESIQERFDNENIHFVWGEKLTVNSDTLQKVQKCDAVILVEKVQQSYWKDIELEYELLKKMRKEILGYVLI